MNFDQWQKVIRVYAFSFTSDEAPHFAASVPESRGDVQINCVLNDSLAAAGSKASTGSHSICAIACYDSEVVVENGSVHVIT